MNEYRQRDADFLRTAQAAERVHADNENRNPVAISLDTPVTLRMLAEILRNPRGLGLD